MPKFEIEFEAFCSACGAGICRNVIVGRHNDRIDVEPCDACLEAAKEEGEKDGYDEGYRACQEEKSEQS